MMKQPPRHRTRRLQSSSARCIQGIDERANKVSKRDVERVEAGAGRFFQTCGPISSPQGKRRRARTARSYTPRPGTYTREAHPRHTCAVMRLRLPGSLHFGPNLDPALLLRRRSSLRLPLPFVCRPQDARAHSDCVPALIDAKMSAKMRKGETEGLCGGPRARWMRRV